MSKSNAVTPASFQYINHRFAQKVAFLFPLSIDQLRNIESAYDALEDACGVIRFIKNLVELQERELISDDNAFWISTENDEGISRIISEFQYDINQSREHLKDVDARLIDVEKARSDLGLFYDQLDLINSLAYQCRRNDSRMTIESFSFYCSIFQNIHSITNSIYRELAVLLEAAKQANRSEAAEGVS